MVVYGDYESTFVVLNNKDNLIEGGENRKITFFIKKMVLPVLVVA